jgi:type I restriction enzyme S subunit
MLYHRRYFVEHASGTTFKELSGSVLGDLFFPIAPLREQRWIVSRIDELFTEIAEGEAALERARKSLNTWRRALLKAAVTGELTREWRKANKPAETGAEFLARICAAREDASQRPDLDYGRSSGGPINPKSLKSLPAGWVWAKMSELGNVTGGLTKNRDREGYPIKEPFLRVANVQMGRLDLSDMKEIGVQAGERKRLLLSPHDLLVVEGNGSIDQIGRCALWNDQIRPCVHQNHIIKVRFTEPTLSSWALQWLLSPSGREEIKSVASSTSGLHTLSISKIQNLPVPVPPLAEAIIALRHLEESLAVARDVECHIARLFTDKAALRQSILKSAFEGRLVPQDPNDEPASALLASLREQSVTTPPRSRRRRSAP